MFAKKSTSTTVVSEDVVKARDVWLTAAAEAARLAREDSEARDASPLWERYRAVEASLVPAVRNNEDARARRTVATSHPALVPLMRLIRDTERHDPVRDAAIAEARAAEAKARATLNQASKREAAVILASGLAELVPLMQALYDALDITAEALTAAATPGLDRHGLAEAELVRAELAPLAARLHIAHRMAPAARTGAKEVAATAAASKRLDARRREILDKRDALTPTQLQRLRGQQQIAATELREQAGERAWSRVPLERARTASDAEWARRRALAEEAASLKLEDFTE